MKKHQLISLVSLPIATLHHTITIYQTIHPTPRTATYLLHAAHTTGKLTATHCRSTICLSISLCLPNITLCVCMLTGNETGCEMNDYEQQLSAPFVRQLVRAFYYMLHCVDGLVQISAHSADLTRQPRSVRVVGPLRHNLTDMLQRLQQPQ